MNDAGDLALLSDLNDEIARAEDRGDAAFFEQLLHQRFAMLRPNGAWEGRDGFIGRLAAGGSRHSRPGEMHIFGRRATVWCVVDKADDGVVNSNHNLRTFVRSSPEEPWQLVTWLNEPLAEPG